MSHPNAVTISVSDDMLRSFFQRQAARLVEEIQARKAKRLTRKLANSEGAGR